MSQGTTLLLLLLSVVAATVAVFLPARFPPSLDDIQKVCFNGNENNSRAFAPLQMKPLWCFLYPFPGGLPNLGMWKPNRARAPHICLTDSQVVSCSLDIREKCPRSFNVHLMREEDGVECQRFASLTMPNNGTSTTTKPSMTRNLHRFTYGSGFTAEGGECKGPFLCEYSSITRQHICPAKVGPKGSLCIPIPRM